MGGGGGGALGEGGSDTGGGGMDMSEMGMVDEDSDTTGDVFGVSGSGAGVIAETMESLRNISSMFFIIEPSSLVSDSRALESSDADTGPGSVIVSVGEGGGVPAPTRVVLTPPGAVRSTMSTITSTGSAIWTATCALS